jgi:hypothetical protein
MGWLAILWGRVAKFKGWVAKMLAHLLVTPGSLDSNPDIPQKSQMGDICKEVANALLPDNFWN